MHKGTLFARDVLITGGTGSFGQALVRHLLAMGEAGPRRVIVLSRDELKQDDMRKALPDAEQLRFFIGDVRDPRRLRQAFLGVDYVIHAAAMKQVPACEYNPGEAVLTNVSGAMNVIDAAIEMGVKRVVALSTDKACNPVNLYGSTKLAAEKLFVAGNALAGALETRFSVVRYGNVVGSRGSVVPLFRKQAAAGGPITITDTRMTRFWITLPQAVAFVLSALERMEGGEVFIPKLPSVAITELAAAIAGPMEVKVTGIREGEKVHETLLGEDESPRAQVWADRFVILPGQGVSSLVAPPPGFSYRSDTNSWRLTADDVRELIGDVAVPA